MINLHIILQQEHKLQQILVMLLIQYGIIKEEQLHSTADPARTCRLQVYQTEPGFAGSLTTVDVGPLTSQEGGIYTAEYDPGVVNTDALVFNTGRKYIIKAPQSNALDRTFNFVFRGASGGGFIDTQDDTGDTQYTGGYGGFAQGTFTLNQNVWYVLIVGSQGQASQISPLQGGRGNPGESSGANPQTAYSGGGFTGLFDLEIDSVTSSFTQANSVVIEENDDFGSTDPLANQPDRLIIGGLPVVIAGGGGGASPTYGYYGFEDSFYFARGGAGGGAFGNPNGGAGNTSGAGGGGTSSSGGSGPGGGDRGEVLQGGRGGDTEVFNNPGGGGGGGFYGGGGGRQEIESTTDAEIKSQGGGGGSAIIAEGEEQISPMKLLTLQEFVKVELLAIL